MLENEKPIQNDKLHDQIYVRLCDLLRNGEFTPGKAVRVSQISKAFGVSAMPVREALTRLLAIGVLDNVSGRSVGVPVLQHKELTDLRNVRLEVETLAVRWAVKNRTTAFVTELGDLLACLERAEQSGEVQGHIKANYEFHSRLYQQSKSSVLMDIIDTLWLRVSPHLYQLKRNHIRISNNHHRKIVESVRKGDADGAAAALEADITEAYDVLVKALFNH